MTEYGNVIEVLHDEVRRTWFETDGSARSEPNQRLRCDPDMGESGNPTAASSRPRGEARVIALAPGRSSGAV